MFTKASNLFIKKWNKKEPKFIEYFQNEWLNSKGEKARLQYSGVRVEYERSTAEYGLSTVEYEWSTVEYDGVRWSTSGVRWSTSGVQAEYSGVLEYRSLAFSPLLNSHDGWYEGIKHLTPSTNNDLESNNRAIQ
jgi:hypothetical protein